MKLQNHNAHKKKNSWTPKAQTGTRKNNRQSKKMGEIKKKQLPHSVTYFCRNGVY